MLYILLLSACARWEVLGVLFQLAGAKGLTSRLRALGVCDLLCVRIYLVVIYLDRVMHMCVVCVCFQLSSVWE